MEHDLAHHGDREVGHGLVDLAVNVRMGAPPDWLLHALRHSLDNIGSYPDTAAATEAIADRHGRDTAEVLPTAGAAEAFTLLANTLRPKRTAVVHPQFTEPEAAMMAAGHTVERVRLDARDGFALRTELVPDDADLVFLGNPTNPTSVLHPAQRVRELSRPGRLLVVDEAFADAVPGERESLAGQRPSGTVIVRSLTKTWAIAGLRAGYLLADPDVVTRLRSAQPPWSVSAPAAAAMVACSGTEARERAEELAVSDRHDRKVLLDGLRDLGIEIAAAPSAPFVLIRVPGGERVRAGLRAAGYAVRRGDTFPGLGPDWMRIAVRDEPTIKGFLAALADVLAVV